MRTPGRKLLQKQEGAARTEESMITNHHLDGTPIGSTPRCDDTYKIYSNAKPYTEDHLAANRRIEEIEERIRRLEAQYPPLTTVEARIEAIESAVATIKQHTDKLERLFWEMNKQRGTDGLVDEQDMLAANRRIEALEKLTCIKGNENANGITSATARVAATEARIKALEDRLQTVWIAPINELKERCYALENDVSSFKLCVPPPQPPCPPEPKKKITLELIHADQMAIYDLLRGMIYDMNNRILEHFYAIEKVWKSIEKPNEKKE